MSEIVTREEQVARDRVARQWVLRERSGSPMQTDDLRRLRDWLRDDARNRQALARERQAWCDLDAVSPSFASSAPAPIVARRGGRRWIVGAVAAAACFLLAIPSGLEWLRTDVATAAGQVGRTRLPDGTLAVLDTASAIDIAYNGNSRTVRLLRGRAWFDVRHGDRRPFRVLTGQGAVQDIGTAFEVERIAEGTGVAVGRGAVRAAAGPGAATLLHAGARARMKNGWLKRLPDVPAEQVAAWRRGEIVFRKTPLYYAVSVVGRYRSAPTYVWGDLVGLAPVSGNFRTDRPDDALATLVAMRGMKRLDLPGGIVILRRADRK
jgi:transmembrane sensor